MKKMQNSDCAVCKIAKQLKWYTAIWIGVAILKIKVNGTKRFHISSIDFDSKNKRWIITALLVIVGFFFSFWNDMQFYENGKISVEKAWYWLGKIVFFVLLFLGWNEILLKTWNKEKQHMLKCVLIYFIPMLILLILTWPGVWRSDEMYVLRALQQGKLYFWQHWITSMFYMLCLQLCPVPGIIVVVQVFIISIIVGDIVYRSYGCFEKVKKGRYAYFLYFSLFLPTILDNNLSPIRASLCSYLELWILFQIIFCGLEKKKYSMEKMCKLAVIAAIAASWRPENIIYVAALPAACFIWKNINLKKNIVFLCLTGLLMGTIMTIQNNGLRQQELVTQEGYCISDKDRYAFSGMVEPLAQLIVEDFKSDTKEEDLKFINEVISLDAIDAYGGIGAFWQGGLRNLSPENLMVIKKLYVRLVFENWDLFLQQRFQYFLKTKGFGFRIVTCLKSAAHLYDEDIGEYSGEEMAYWYKDFQRRYLWNQPLNVEVRKHIISFLEGKKITDYEYSTSALELFFQNAVPFLVLLILVGILELVNKRMVFPFVIMFILGKCFIVMLTAPAMYFMYYFSAYLSSAIVCVMACLCRKFVTVP